MQYTIPSYTVYSDSSVGNLSALEVPFQTVSIVIVIQMWSREVRTKNTQIYTKKRSS